MCKKFIAGILSCVSLTTMAQAGRLVLEVDLSEEQKTAICQKFVEPYNEAIKEKKIYQRQLAREDLKDSAVLSGACLPEYHTDFNRIPKELEVWGHPGYDPLIPQILPFDEKYCVMKESSYPDLNFLQTATIGHDLMHGLTEDDAWRIARDLRKTAGNTFKNSQEAGLTYTVERQERIGDIPYKPPYRYLYTNVSIEEKTAIEEWIEPWSEVEKFSQFKRNPLFEFGTNFTYAKFSTDLGLSIPIDLLDKEMLAEIKNAARETEPLTLNFKKLKLTYVPNKGEEGEGFSVPFSLKKTKL